MDRLQQHQDNSLCTGPPRAAYRPSAKRRRRGTKISETQPSPQPDSDDGNRIQGEDNLQGPAPNSTLETNLTGVVIQTVEFNDNQERGRVDETLQAPTTIIRPERAMAGDPVLVLQSHNTQQTTRSGPTTSRGRQGHLELQLEAFGGSASNVLVPETPTTRTPHSMNASLVSPNAETEANDSSSIPTKFQPQIDCDLHLIHLAFPQPGGSAEREGIESIRCIARRTHIPDSIPVGLLNSQDIPTSGFGVHVPCLNTPQMTAEPADVVNLETTNSNQAHSSAWTTFGEEQMEAPYGRRNLFTNFRDIDRGIDLGLLDQDQTCPPLTQENEETQSWIADNMLDNAPESPVPLPSDTQDFRSRVDPRSYATQGFSVGDIHRLVARNEEEDLANVTTKQTAHASQRAETSRTRGRRGPHNKRPIGPRIGLPRQPRVPCPMPQAGPTATVPTSPSMETRPVGEQDSGTAATAPASTSPTVPSPIYTESSVPRRTRRALSPSTLARVRHADKVRKRGERKKFKLARQRAATHGATSGAVSMLEREILELCAGEPQGDSHKDAMAALSQIVPTELPCYREIKTVTTAEIEQICKKLADQFANAQELLPTWTRKAVGRLLKARRTRTRRKVKRLMAARARVVWGQPVPPMPLGVFQVELDHFTLQLEDEEFIKKSKLMTDRSNNMIKKKGCGNKVGAGGYERAKAHIAKREGRPATTREVRKWKTTAERAYDVGPSRTAANQRIAGVSTGLDADVETSVTDGSSFSSGSSNSSLPSDSDGSSSLDGSSAHHCFVNPTGNTDFDSSSEDGVASHGAGMPVRTGLDVMPANWHHPIRGVGEFFDRYTELFGEEPGDREVAVWEANGRPWLHRPT